MARPLVAFNWFGGKASMLNKLLPLVDGTTHHTYVEPFGGSAAVLLNKKTSPVEVYNDAYGDVCNFFRVLRTHGDELVRLIELTPYSREEFALSCDRGGCDELESARRFFVTARQVMMGLATTATPGRFCAAAKQSRRGMPLVVSRWLSAIDGLPAVAARLREVIIENLDALDIIRKYDYDRALFYLDPAYPMATRSGGKGYAHEMTDGRHSELLDLIKSVKGKVLLSSYPSEMYSEALRGWNCVQIAGGSHSARFHKGAELKRTELVWSNF